MKLKGLLVILLLTVTCFAQSGRGTKKKGGDTGRPTSSSVTDADNYRKSVLQSLQVAQNPVHTKQDKATEAEIAAYAQAAQGVAEFKEWLVRDTGVRVSPKLQGNSNDLINRKRFMKAAWAIHDAQIKTEGPFTRSDIGVAVKVMNDAREIFQMPLVMNSTPLDEDYR